MYAVGNGVCRRHGGMVHISDRQCMYYYDYMMQFLIRAQRKSVVMKAL